MKGLLKREQPEPENIIEGYELREMWQTFMTGNYYYCFNCQSQCFAALSEQE
jgi:hypothetical protein